MTFTNDYIHTLFGLVFHSTEKLILSRIGFGFLKTVQPTESLFEQSITSVTLMSSPSTTTPTPSPELASHLRRLPSALTDVTLLSQLKRAVETRTLVCFLDYDGTLSPIVSDPEKAFISEATRNLLYALPKAGVKTVVITGRSLERIQCFCAPLSSTEVTPLYFCASHGFDIHGPNLSHQPFPEYRQPLLAAKEAMMLALSGIPGVTVEDNFFSISIHYRNVDATQHASTIELAEKAALGSISTKRRPSALAQVVEADKEGLPPKSWSTFPVTEESIQKVQLEMRPGKFVTECRPKPHTSWHKGKALEWLIKNQLLQNQEALTVIVIGDDLTDEDSFAEALSLAETKIIAAAIPIIVSEEEDLSRPTLANWKLKNPKEVCELLSLLLTTVVNT